MSFISQSFERIRRLFSFSDKESKVDKYNEKLKERRRSSKVSKLKRRMSLPPNCHKEVFSSESEFYFSTEDIAAGVSSLDIGFPMTPKNHLVGYNDIMYSVEDVTNISNGENNKEFGDYHVIENFFSKSASNFGSGQIQVKNGSSFYSNLHLNSSLVDLQNASGKYHINTIQRKRNVNRKKMPKDPSQEKNSSRRNSVKELLKRSVSLFYYFDQSQEEDDIADHEDKAFESRSNVLDSIKSSLLFVFRNSTFPPEGIHRFHMKLHAMKANQKGKLVKACWKKEVVPQGLQILSVGVASPLKGDQIAALADIWDTLYKHLIPLFEILLSPLRVIQVRYDLLSSFRKEILIYLDLQKLIEYNRESKVEQHSKLLQMALILAKERASCWLCSERLRKESTISGRIFFDFFTKVLFVILDRHFELDNKGPDSSVATLLLMVHLHHRSKLRRRTNRYTQPHRCEEKLDSSTFV